MRRTTLVLVAVWIGLASVPLRALCERLPLEQQFARSAVVFVGRATAQEIENVTRVVTTFTVQEMWKGAPATEVRVTTCGQGRRGDELLVCDPDSFTSFRIGSTYLVFASGDPLRTSACVSTALLERASATLEWLAKQPRLTGR
jgi:hypothetical protein